ncbi:hypothetical protein JQ543_23220 [Bradyrhizobium diazoefficiens]|nr:hypothetical protein [Bradyrhizobium diazoefficiens]MBR0850671.1 hypothetical protein [Bradyrhizobium diazoefficiens]
MEALEDYLDRKHQELELLNAALAKPSKLRRPGSVVEAIRQKFQLAAALKAEHALHEWTLTETAWTSARPHAGPFVFDYDYQRADLTVSGPSFYDFAGADDCPTIYTSSGMAAISALLLACVRVLGPAELVLWPGSYGETVEFVDRHARGLRRLTPDHPRLDCLPGSGQRRIVLLDSSTPFDTFAATLREQDPRLDLVIFDTTCFSSGSGRIRRVLSWARRWKLPVVLVRSHTKLDSLGLEYGRMGSAVFVGDRSVGEPGARMLQRLFAEMRDAVRLLGGAALPAHFPPFVGSKAYRVLTGRRIAAMLRNGRRSARCFADRLGRASGELHFAHGLYVTLLPPEPLDESGAKQVAAELSEDLTRAGMLLRHAGSFGFDFGAAEWGYDQRRDRYLFRIAIPDLPTALWDDIAHAVADWWLARYVPGSPAETRPFAQSTPAPC